MPLMSVRPLILIAACLSLANGAKLVDPEVSGTSIVAQLTKLAEFSEDKAPAVTRVIFTPQDVAARAYIKELMSEAGLTIREDAMGNIFGRLEGSDPLAGAVASGSHIDAIPQAGMYDGTLGVVGAIAALKALQAAGFKPERSIDAIMFTSEEPTRFGLGCIGSRGMAGTLKADWLDERKDVNGSTFLEAGRSVGLDSKSHKEMLKKTYVQPSSLSAFLELHIEQGPLLEREGTDLGIVTAIAAPAALRVTFTGSGGHAGALLMPDRHDAGLAAAQVALDAEAAALRTGAIDTVATTGKFDIGPNTMNSVPRHAHLEIDVRDIDGDRRDTVVQSIIKSVKDNAKKRGLDYTVDIINQDPPAKCAKQVTDAVQEAAVQIGASYKEMVSRAYHDSSFMAQIAPTAMVFIPCRNGWSHRPDEFASPENIERGVKALAISLAKLAGQSADRTEL